jgi:hypothetical protein
MAQNATARARLRKTRMAQLWLAGAAAYSCVPWSTEGSFFIMGVFLLVLVQSFDFFITFLKLVEAVVSLGLDPCPYAVSGGLKAARRA